MVTNNYFRTRVNSDRTTVGTKSFGYRVYYTDYASQVET